VAIDYLASGCDSGEGTKTGVFSISDLLSAAAAVKAVRSFTSYSYSRHEASDLEGSSPVSAAEKIINHLTLVGTSEGLSCPAAAVIEPWSRPPGLVTIRAYKAGIGAIDLYDLREAEAKKLVASMCMASGCDSR
jgi:hypothetical protein